MKEEEEDENGEGEEEEELPELPDFDTPDGRQYWLDVITMENDIERHQILGQIYDMVMFENISKYMSYGQLRSFEDWCKREITHGNKIPWHIFGVPIPFAGRALPLPYFSIPLWIGFIVSVGLGYEVGPAFYLTVITQIAIVAASFVLSGFEYNIKGRCHRCGKTIPRNRKTKVLDWRKIERSHSDAGHCDSCAWQIHRSKGVQIITNKRWDSIVLKKNKVRGIIFKVWADPFPGGKNNTYTLADRKFPKDGTTDDDYWAKAEDRAMETVNMIRAARGKKRFGF